MAAAAAAAAPAARAGGRRAEWSTAHTSGGSCPAQPPLLSSFLQNETVRNFQEVPLLGQHPKRPPFCTLPSHHFPSFVQLPLKPRPPSASRPGAAGGRAFSLARFSPSIFVHPKPTPSGQALTLGPLGPEAPSHRPTNGIAIHSSPCTVGPPPPNEWLAYVLDRLDLRPSHLVSLAPLGPQLTCWYCPLANPVCFTPSAGGTGASPPARCRLPGLPCLFTALPPRDILCSPPWGARAAVVLRAATCARGPRHANRNRIRRTARPAAL